MQISRIAEIDASNKNIAKIIVFDKTMKDTDLKMLIEQFDYGQEMVEKSIKLYRNVAIVMALAKKDEPLTTEWKLFLERHFPKKAAASKFDNIFLNKGYDKLLLITNRRLVTVDVKKLNEKITQINYDIAYYNESLEEETPHEPEKRTFGDVIKGIFR